MMCLRSDTFSWVSDPMWIMVMAMVLSASIWLQRSQMRSTSEKAFDKLSDSTTPDVGEVIRVAAWEGDRHTQVRYCGKNWMAKLRDGSPSEPGAFRISSIEGDSLILEKDVQRAGASRF